MSANVLRLRSISTLPRCTPRAVLGPMQIRRIRAETIAAYYESDAAAWQGDDVENAHIPR